MQRRRLLTGLVASLPLPFVGRASHAEADAPRPDPKPMLFKFGTQYLRVCPVEETLEVVDRREILGHLPQPEPTQVIEVSGERGLHVLVWDADPSGSCVRCRYSCGVGLSQLGDWRCGIDTTRAD